MTSAQPQWPDELDAPVAAPAHHALVLENDRVRVLDARVEPGDVVPVHTHSWPAVQYLLSVSDFVRRDGEGQIVADTRSLDETMEAPLTLWTEPVPPHSLENVGDAAIHAIVVEVKDTQR